MKMSDKKMTSHSKSNGSNTDETRIRDENLEQEQTEKTEENAGPLFSLFAPVNSFIKILRDMRRKWTFVIEIWTQIGLFHWNICVHLCLSVARLFVVGRRRSAIGGVYAYPNFRIPGLH